MITRRILYFYLVQRLHSEPVHSHKGIKIFSIQERTVVIMGPTIDALQPVCGPHPISVITHILMDFIMYHEFMVTIPRRRKIMRPIIDVLASVIGPHLSPAEVIAQEAIQKLKTEGYVIISQEKLLEQIHVVDTPEEGLALLAEKVDTPERWSHLLNGLCPSCGANTGFAEHGPNCATRGTADIVQCWFDGNGNATNGKPGLAQWRIYWANGEMTPGVKEYPVGTPGMTNNFLEYQGLIHCLEMLHKINPGSTSIGLPITIMGDSRLVVEQTNGRWRVKEAHLVPLRDRAQQLLHGLKNIFKDIELKWCPSEQNRCDAHA